MPDFFPMPAVSLSKLKTQVDLLLRLWQQPDELVQNLAKMLEYYSDQLYQAAEQTRQTPSLPAYRVPAVILRQLELELGRAAAADPQQGLAVAESLWQQNFLEMRQLSASILGALPAAVFPAVIRRLSSWSSTDIPSDVSINLLGRASRQMRRLASNQWLEVIRNWLQKSEPALQILGLHALVSLVEDTEFTNLPPIFSTLSPMIQNSPPNLAAELLPLLNALCRRSPAETTYLFRKIAATSPRPETLRLLRRALPALPLENQQSLKPVLLEPKTTPGADNQTVS